MAHTFLIQSGQWMLEGNWIDRNQRPITVRGKTLVAWNQTEWFNMATKLVFPNSDRDHVLLKYRGRLDANGHHYSFVLQHSEWGNVEGEGLIGPESIVQNYWVLGDERQRRSGFDTLRQIDTDRYYYSSSMTAGHHLNLVSMMETILERKP
ncbi:MAG: hypothetical protein SWJ54_03030 [Cyanobacteriota bacterium]|nr:hypothetical protein [Cyanobacteriota bacterium]